MTAKTKNKIKQNLIGYALILPLLISLTIFTIYPLLLALFQSFFKDFRIYRYTTYDWSTFGFGNYAHAFKDETFWKSLRITFVYAIISVMVSLSLSFVAAYFLSKDFNGAKVFRILYYLPCLIPGIVSAIIYRYIYAGDASGFLNSLMRVLHISDTPVEFFNNETEWIALASFMSITLFSIGSSSPFWIAGFKSVPKSYYEAAELDGIPKSRVFFKITIPMMSKYIFFQLIIGVIGAFQVGQGVLQFSETGGANANLTFLGLSIYNRVQAAGGFNYGYASALSYILFVIIAGLSIIMFRYNKFVYYEGKD